MYIHNYDLVIKTTCCVTLHGKTPTLLTINLPKVSFFAFLFEMLTIKKVGPTSETSDFNCFTFFYKKKTI